MYKTVLLLALIIPGAFAASQAAVVTAGSTVASRSFDDLEQTMQTRQREQRRQLEAKEQEFVQRFNRLAEAMEAFSHNYKETHSIDLKQVKSIREAYRKLQQSDPWFRID